MSMQFGDHQLATRGEDAALRAWVPVRSKDRGVGSAIKDYVERLPNDFTSPTRPPLPLVTNSNLGSPAAAVAPAPTGSRERVSEESTAHVLHTEQMLAIQETTEPCSISPWQQQHAHLDSPEPLSVEHRFLALSLANPSTIFWPLKLTRTPATRTIQTAAISVHLRWQDAEWFASHLANVPAWVTHADHGGTSMAQAQLTSHGASRRCLQPSTASALVGRGFNIRCSGRVAERRTRKTNSIPTNFHLLRLSFCSSL